MMTLDPFGPPTLVSARSQPFSVGLVTFSLQPSYPSRADSKLHPEHLPQANRSPRSARDARQVTKEVVSRTAQCRFPSEHRCGLPGGRGCVDPAWAGIENCVGSVGSGKMGRDRTTFRLPQVPISPWLCRWRSARVRFMLADPRSSQRCKKGTRHWGTSQPRAPRRNIDRGRASVNDGNQQQKDRRSGQAGLAG